jgi:hypothetical protein
MSVWRTPSGKKCAIATTNQPACADRPNAREVGNQAGK